MRQIYITDPSQHRFLVNEANRPGSIVTILGSVLRMLPGFRKKQNNTIHNQNGDEQVSATPESSTIETVGMVNNNSAVNNEVNVENEGNTIHYNDTISEDEVFLNTRNIAHQRDDNPDTVDSHVKQGQHNNTQSSKLSPIHTEVMLRMHCAHNEMLSH